MKYIKFTFISAFASLAFICQTFAETTVESESGIAVGSKGNIYNDATRQVRASPPAGNNENFDTDGASAVVETLLVRPLGLVALISGTALFVAMSPLTAFASIPSPHDAFAKTADALIVSPAEYTFIRPLGDFSYRSKEK